LSTLHIYAFGSICRGEVSRDSDVDLLAVWTGGPNSLNRRMFSIYAHRRIKEIWQEGNPFAWHLHLEARPLFLGDGMDFLANLGAPGPYTQRARDCAKFHNLLQAARASAETSRSTIVFDLSAAFLAIRNFATCYRLDPPVTYDFSRHSACCLMGDTPCISADQYAVLERARILCTRGTGEPLSTAETSLGFASLASLDNWMTGLRRDLGA
jgi:Nucleotidyltransferase domain